MHENMFPTVYKRLYMIVDVYSGFVTLILHGAVQMTVYPAKVALFGLKLVENASWSISDMSGNQTQALPLKTKLFIIHGGRWPQGV